MHVVEAPLPESVHEPLMELPVEVRVTVPEGGIADPVVAVSVTVIVHAEAVPTVTGLEHVIVVDVVRTLTVMLDGVEELLV